ncbi:MAG: hypothetical protein RLZZ459_597, partial [Cyanobacteriota bacterium]
AVCGSCGCPRSAASSSWNPLKRFAASAGPSFKPNRRTGSRIQTAVAWFLPLSLVGSYLWVSSDPQLLRRWTTPTEQGSWLIETPADTELLIAEAGKFAPGAENDQDSATAIRQLTRSLLTSNVRLRISRRVQEGAAGEWDPGVGEIRIKPEGLQMGLNPLAQILAHEATHVAQSCKGGGIGKNSIPLGIEVDPATTFESQLNSGLYAGHPAGRAIELEAFTAGARPAWAAQLVDHFCPKNRNLTRR